jgi:epoxyqueuosine reductase
MNYYPPETIPEEDNFIIARYTYGRSYRKLIRERMESLAAFMKSEFDPHSSKCFVDSGPVQEKAWAQKCGVGWQGKHTILINRSSGSFNFIGIILTTLDLEADEPEKDQCGNCSLCMDACPTGALNTPYQLQLDRCISYHTIENRGEVPEEVRKNMNDRIYGCEICQDVCPWNRKAIPHNETSFLPKERVMEMRKEDWLNLGEEEFAELFKESEMYRPGLQNLQRNMALCLGLPPPETGQDEPGQ